MFWLATARMLLRPMPPMPTQAMFRRSLGGVKPRPSTCLGTMAMPAPVMRRGLDEMPPGYAFFRLVHTAPFSRRS